MKTKARPLKSKFTRYAIVGLAVFAGASIQAQNDPYSGYANTNSYFLTYANGTSFTGSNPPDVEVEVTIAGRSHRFNVDTGSRGLYVSSTELGPDFVIAPGAYPGEIDLDSSGRVSAGMWTAATLSFDVTDGNGVKQTVTSTPYILDVMTISAQMGRTATFSVDTTVTGYNGTVNLVGGGTVPVTFDATTNKSIISLTHSAVVDQQVSYAGNIPGLIEAVSNFGIGFDLSGAAGGTGPVGNDMNQIYNPLINLDKMRDGTLVAGYIVESTGIQLGLTSADKGYAYTNLTPTGLTSTNSVPDWQTPMGQTVVNNVLNRTGSVVMDSGIPNAFLSAPGLTVGDTITTPISVVLMNSGGAAGYNIDPGNATNVLNPASVLVVAAGTDGVYPQSQPPYQAQFFNTGRNVFLAFNMLYDAQHGYMGVLPNSVGAADPNVFFSAQEGGFPNPIPAPSPAPTPAPMPTLTVKKPKPVRGAKAVITGTATNATWVQFKLEKKGPLSLVGVSKSTWKATVRSLSTGGNDVFVRAVSASGMMTSFTRVKITRKR